MAEVALVNGCDRASTSDKFSLSPVSFLMVEIVYFAINVVSDDTTGHNGSTGMPRVYKANTGAL